MTFRTRFVAMIWSVALSLAVASATQAEMLPESLRENGAPWLCLSGSNTIGSGLAPRLVRGYLGSVGLESGTPVPSALDEATIAVPDGDTIRQVAIRFHGTGTGYEALRDGRCDIWMASRPAREAEMDAPGLRHLRSPAQEAVIALDGLAIIVHPDNPVGELDREQVRDVFSGRVRDWSELGGRAGRIMLHARDDNSGTYDTFRTLVLGDATLAPGAARYESTDELSRQVGVDTNAIGFVGLAGVRRNKALRIRDGDAPALAPTPFNVATEDYALARRLFLYVRAEASEQARGLLAFAQSDAAQTIVQDTGFVPMTPEAQVVQPRADAPTEYLALTDGAQRLSLSFRFGAGQVFLDSRAERDLDRLADWLRAPGRDGLEVILAGFTEPAEFSPIVSIGHSIDRADIIARELVQRKVRVRYVRGYGPALPITDGSGEIAQAKNRRVEVWVRPATGRGAAARGATARR